MSSQFGSSSTTPVIPSPTIYFGSSSYYQSGWPSSFNGCGEVPYIQSTSINPIFTLPSGAQGGGAVGTAGSLHIPGASALIPEICVGYDHHIFVRDLAYGTDWEVWESGIPVSAGQLPGCNAANVGCTAAAEPGAYDNYPTSTFNGVGIAGAGGNISDIFEIRPEDVLNSRIPYAIPFQTSCDVRNGSGGGLYYYPVILNRGGYATDNGNYCSTPNFPYGSHIWSDVPYTSLPSRGSSSCDILSWAIMRNANEFGWYMNDIGGGNVTQLHFAPDLNDTIGGGTSQWAQVYQQINGSAPSNNSQWHPNITSCGVNVATHFHVLIPPAPQTSTPGPSPSPSPSPITYYTPTASAAPQLAANPNPYTTRVCPADPCSPVIDSSSNSYNSAWFNGGVVVMPSEPLNSSPTGPAYEQWPVYSSTNSNPLYYIDCSQDCYPGTGTGNEIQVHIPNGAHSNNNGAMAVYNSSSNIEVDGIGWPNTDPVSNGSPYPLMAGYAHSAASNCMTGPNSSCEPESIGMLDPVELLQQNIPHSLHLVSECTGSGHVYPQQESDGNTAGCPPQGEILWLDKTDAQIEAMSQPRWVKTIYHAMHRYGFVSRDTTNGSQGPITTIQMVDDITWTYNGGPSQWAIMINEMKAEGGGFTFPAPTAGFYPIKIPTDPSISVSNMHWLQLLQQPGH
jgi:hypothetical protein